MRLRQGSYYYIIGVFLMLLSGISATISIILGVRYQSEFPGSNEILSDYGNFLMGDARILWLAGIFGFLAVAFAGYIFFTALKKNNIVMPMRVLGVGMLVFAITITVLLILDGGRYGSLADIVARYLHIPPIAALGVSLICLSLGKKNSRMPSVFFSAMCGYASFAGFGFEKLFAGDLVRLTDTALHGYCALFLFSLALALFFVGISFCVGSCERRKKAKKFEFAEE